jgi:soluble lytic murein transglycosylase-like protein
MKRPPFTPKIFAFLLASVAAVPAQAEVFEMSAEGRLVNITQARWQMTPALREPIFNQSKAMPDVVQPPVSPPQASSPQAVVVQQHIQDAAVRYGINGALLDAVAWQESRYRHHARSPVGAIGVMQLMPATARSLGVTDPTNLVQNVSGGAAYLRAQLERFGNDVPLALAAYNAGPGAVLKYRGIPPYRETQNYVRQIMNRLAATSAIFAPY